MNDLAPLFSRLCFVDVETTGLDAATDELLEIGCVFVERGAIVGRHAWLVAPTRPVPPLITALTGLTDDEVATGRPFKQLGAELEAAWAGWTMVAHNAAFERGFLTPLLNERPMLDSFELSHLLAPELNGHSLDALIRFLGVGRAARHRALDDAEDTFLMLAALCDRARLQTATPHTSLLEVLAQLPERADADRAALRHFLQTLAELPITTPPRPRAPAGPLPAQALELGAQLSGWLRAPLVVTAELEESPSRDTVALEVADPSSTEGSRLTRGLVLGAALDAAQRAGEPVAVAVPLARAREWAADPATASLPVRVLPRRPLCLTALRAQLANEHPPQPRDRREELARAALVRWVSITPAADADLLSRFILEGGPGVRALIDAAKACQCPERAQEQCGLALSPAESAAVVVSHAHALDWLERGAPLKIVFLEADQLPEAERRRTFRGLFVSDLEALGLEGTELRRALAAVPAGLVPLRERLRPPWLAVREAITPLFHALRGRPLDGERERLLERIVEVLAPPPPGFETHVGAEFVSRVPVRLGDRLMRRLRGGHCLLSPIRGGLAWTRASSLARPAVGGAAELEWVEPPLTPTALVELVRREPRALVVSPGPLEPLIEAFLAAGTDLCLEAARDAAVMLHEWRRDRPLPTDGPGRDGAGRDGAGRDGAGRDVAERAVFFYGVREFRRAVLSTRARRVVLAAPHGLDAGPLRRALVGLQARKLPP